MKYILTTIWIGLLSYLTDIVFSNSGLTLSLGPLAAFALVEGGSLLAQKLLSGGGPKAPKISEEELNQMIALLSKNLGKQQQQQIEQTRQSTAGAPRGVQIGAQAETSNQQIQLLANAIAQLQGKALQFNLGAKQQQYQLDVANQQSLNQGLQQLGYNLALLAGGGA